MANNSAEMFGTNDPKELALRTDAFNEAISKSLQSADMAQATPNTNKSFGLDPVSIGNQIAAQREILKDITVGSTVSGGIYTAGSPIGSGIVPFDLEAPAKYLAPRPTPLRNKMPRLKGSGTSHRYKRITAITGSGTGQGDVHPGLSEITQNNFAPAGASQALYYARGSKIAYTGDDKIVPYYQFGLSDSVSWAAQYAGQGFQDIRSLSAQSLLYSSMLMEEKMMLMGRGATGGGFVGALTAPTITATASATTTGETAFTAGTYFVAAAADAGAFGSGPGSNIVASVVVAAGQVLQVTVTGASVGALGYRIYAGTTTGFANMTYQTRGGSSVIRVQGTYTTTGAVATASDTSSYAQGYDGIMPIVTGADSGYRKVINSTFNASSPGAEFQTCFSALYDAVKADPDEILFNGADRKQISELLKNNSSTNYRLTLQQDEVGNAVIGSVITAIQNEVTGKVVPMTVHPWMPQGNTAVLSYQLPIPDSQVSNVWTSVNVQDYTGINWPVTQFEYETSSYWYGTFLCYAPAWNGSITGITAA